MVDKTFMLYTFWWKIAETKTLRENESLKRCFSLILFFCCISSATTSFFRIFFINKFYFALTSVVQNTVRNAVLKQFSAW